MHYRHEYLSPLHCEFSVAHIDRTKSEKMLHKIYKRTLPVRQDITKHQILLLFSDKAVFLYSLEFAMYSANNVSVKENMNKKLMTEKSKSPVSKELFFQNAYNEIGNKVKKTSNGTIKALHKYTLFSCDDRES